MRAAVLTLVLAYARVAAADGADVNAHENLDVLEMKNGSVYKGVIVEQTSEEITIAIGGDATRTLRIEDIAFISKVPNPAFAAGMTGTEGGAASDPTMGATPMIRGSVPTNESSGLPLPLARSGLQIQAELAVLFPIGDIDDDATSFGPTLRLGYEAIYGHLGLGGGAHLRYASWDVPSDYDHHTTTEAHLYGRVGMHIGRIVMFGGVTLGLDVNNVYNNVRGFDDTYTDFGLNFQGGVEVGVSRKAALRFAFDYHPPTDTIVEELDTSVEYFALLLGLNIRP